jgi:transposase
MNEQVDNPAIICSECIELRKDIEELKAIILELQQRINHNSSNSSIPPSANPPNAPKRPPQEPTGRKQGGQQGHRGHFRRQLPPARVNEVVEYIPEKCSKCQTQLPRVAAPDNQEPRRHKVAELPLTPFLIIEHQAHSRVCPCCGKINRAEIPPQILSHTIGLRLAAAMSCFGGAYRLSRRSVEEILERVFGVPISIGTIVHLEAQTANAVLFHPKWHFG